MKTKLFAVLLAVSQSCGAWESSRDVDKIDGQVSIGLSLNALPSSEKGDASLYLYCREGNPDSFFLVVATSERVRSVAREVPVRYRIKDQTPISSRANPISSGLVLISKSNTKNKDILEAIVQPSFKLAVEVDLLLSRLRVFEFAHEDPSKVIPFLQRCQKNG
jgi:hypothetical protein